MSICCIYTLFKIYPLDNQEKKKRKEKKEWERVEPNHD